MRHLIVLLFLMGCGTDDTAPSDAAQADRKGFSIAAKTRGSLPDCSVENDGQLAYIQAEKALVYCESGSWVDADLATVAGPQGPKGAKGDVGDPGSVGEAGEDGLPGQDAEPLPTNQWFDPISELTWLIGGSGVITYVNEGTACQNGWRIPTLAEARAASVHGLGTAVNEALSPVEQIWTSSLGNTSGYLWTVIIDSDTPQEQNIGPYGLFCIKE
jgi:hypothetical protein